MLKGSSMLKGLSLASLVVLTGLAATPASARVDVMVGVGPPVPVVETVPGPRMGYVWAPGYWRWHHRAHMWVPGHWIRERHGYHWMADHWDPRGNRYAYVPGHWERD